MIEYKQRDLKQLFKTIKENGTGKEKEVYVSLRPTIPILNTLAEHHPGLQRVYCPPSLYLQTGKQTFSRARDLEIEILGGPYHAGRPNKYDQKEVSRIIGKWKTGIPAKKISEELGIPVRTVYFYINEEKN